MAASLAFTPLPSSAADTDVLVKIDSNSQIEVKVKMDTTEFLRSIQDNKGDINGAISSIIKNAPSDAIKLDTKSDGIAAQKKEAPPPVPSQPAPAPPAVKTEPPKPVETKPVEVKSVETKPVEAKPAEVKPVEPKPVVTDAKPTETASGTATGPKPVIEEEKVQPLKPVETAPSPAKPPEVKKVEEPKSAAPATPAPVPPAVKKDEPKPPEVKKVEEPKPAAPATPAPVPPAVKKDEPKPPEVKKVEEPKPVSPASPIPVPPVVKKDEPKPPEVKKEPKPTATGAAAAVKNDAPKPSVPAPKPPAPRKPEETIMYRISALFQDLFIDLGYVLLSPFEETKEQAKKKNFDDVSFWQRPAFRPTLPARDGKGKVKLYFSRGNVAGGTVFGVAAASLAKYKYDNRKRSERMGKVRNVYDPRNDIRKGIAPVRYSSGEPERYSNDERIRYNSDQRVRYNSGTTMNDNDFNFGRDNSRPAAEYKVPKSNLDQSYSFGSQQVRPDNVRRRDVFADTEAGGDNPWKVSSSPSVDSNEYYSWTDSREPPRSNNMRSTNNAAPRNDRRPERNTYDVPWKDSTGSSSTDRPIVERYSGVGRREDIRPTNTRRRISSNKSRARQDTYSGQNPYKTPNSPGPQSNLYDSFINNEPRRPPSERRSYNSGRSESTRGPANDYRRHDVNRWSGINEDDDFDDGENPWLLRKQGPR
jgi:hypothetical protein